MVRRAEGACSAGSGRTSGGAVSPIRASTSPRRAVRLATRASGSQIVPVTSIPINSSLIVSKTRWNHRNQRPVLRLLNIAR